MYFIPSSRLPSAVHDIIHYYIYDSLVLYEYELICDNFALVSSDNAHLSIIPSRSDENANYTLIVLIQSLDVFPINMSQYL